MPSHFADEFLPLFSRTPDIGSVSETISPVVILEVLENVCWTMDSPAHHIQVPNYSCRHSLNSVQKDNLTELYVELYSTSRSSVELSSVCLKYSHLSMYGKHLGSFKSRFSSSSIVMVAWKNMLFGHSHSFSE